MDNEEVITMTYDAKFALECMEAAPSYIQMRLENVSPQIWRKCVLNFFKDQGFKKVSLVNKIHVTYFKFEDDSVMTSNLKDSFPNLETLLSEMGHS